VTEKHNIVIVSRHAAAIEFVRLALIDKGVDPDTVPVIANATAEDVTGREVYGNVPMHLAALAATVWAIEFTVPPRGMEYTIADMTAAGAKLVPYVVRDADSLKTVLKCLRDEIRNWREGEAHYKVCRMLDSVDDGMYLGTCIQGAMQRTNEAKALQEAKP
jgi:putative CRISPR-associated protein (TIGR02620 family)